MLALVAGGLMTGLVAAAFVRAPPGNVAIAPLAVGTVLFLLGARTFAPPRRWVMALTVLLAALGGAALVPAIEAPGDAGVWSIVGVIESCDASGCVLRVAAMGRAGALPSQHATRARIDGVAGDAGEGISLDAELRPHARFRNPSPHPDWPATSPIAWLGRARASTVRLTPASALRRAIVALRARVRVGLERTLDPPARGIAIALVLGDEAAVDTMSAAQVRGAGLTHVLAVSGMHVTIVVGAILFALLRLCRIDVIATRIDPSRVAHGLAVPLALLYAELAGGAPSAWRAAVTAAIAWSARAIGRRPDPIGTGAIAIIVLATLDPASALRPAFALSIAATAAVVGLPAETSLESLGRASLRASIATAPIVLWCFDGVPVVAVLANVLLLPIVAALVLPLATVHALLAAIATDLAWPTAIATDLACRGFVGACDALSAIDAGRSMPPGNAIEGIVITAGALGLLVANAGRTRLVIAACAFAALACAEIDLRARETPIGSVRATFLDVSQGDAALIDLPDGQLMLVDAGGAFEGGADPGARVIVPLLRARRRARIDRLVVTHPHPDHYGGVAAVAQRVAIGEIWDSGQARAEDPEGAWATLLGFLSRRARVLGPRELCGHPREHAGARVEVLWPCPSFDPGWDANDNSLVVRVTFGARTLLLMGDAEAHAEQALVARGLGDRVDVLKVGHHGSRTSSTEALLATVSPRIAIVSAGVGNRFEHPHREVVDRLASHTDVVFRTDRDGGIVVTTDGHALRADAWSGRDWSDP